MRQVAAGGDFALALRSDGTVLSWGHDDHGQLGDGTTGPGALVPERVCAPGQHAPCSRFLDHVTSVSVGVAGGEYALAVRSDGSVVAWGWNIIGELGNGTTGGASSVPAPVCAPGQHAPCTRFLADVTAVAAGNVHALALLRDGTVFAWGTNGGGRLGDGNLFTSSAVPVPVCAPGQHAPCGTHLGGVAAVAAGATQSLALTRSGDALAWGVNTQGQVGDGTVTNRDVPVPVCAPGQHAPCTAFLHHVTAVSAGIRHSLALGADGSAFGWGSNEDGQLGDGTTANRHTPVPVCAPGQFAACTHLLTHARSITAGLLNSGAVAADGTALTLGRQHRRRSRRRHHRPAPHPRTGLRRRSGLAVRALPPTRHGRLPQRPARTRPGPAGPGVVIGAGDVPSGQRTRTSTGAEVRSTVVRPGAVTASSRARYSACPAPVGRTDTSSVAAVVQRRVRHASGPERSSTQSSIVSPPKSSDAPEAASRTDWPCATTVRSAWRSRSDLAAAGAAASSPAPAVSATTVVTVRRDFTGWRVIESMTGRPSRGACGRRRGTGACFITPPGRGSPLCITPVRADR
ncbi:alpha-tubulin suppressor-like RCC1 family protein [Streptacidiphilus sp. MAP12-33]|uniref:RCC1 domain-containing protein n=1 Tax=Streptacidiphilus sp. MAP12-33 TaxID=3156266 RepID=UPI003511B5BC